MYPMSERIKSRKVQTGESRDVLNAHDSVARLLGLRSYYMMITVARVNRFSCVIELLSSPS
ncbi:hypothetical protein Sinac_4080 [Singulisphaera acidiphila DSM 18658]|uniref:Uncharacterized protein n=1 Tax=Singulisphaera acidiphila (strain ATCC BAA-1392 / DSM 18658 / VKM B-2454 / MOB10) TaxID=886293 RepID=L0DHG8_SINAD|nr:hypothetical protein Sinac_4080 [Singulisphaera acidiphila DSM 18658]